MTGAEIMIVVSVGGKVMTISRGAKAALDWYKEMPNNRRMREAGELFDTVRQIASAEYLTKREADVQDQEAFRASVEAMLADHQFARLQGALGFEAAREATDERLQMLGHAAAGLSDPGMSINEKARIERALRQLDPDDILVLRAAKERKFLDFRARVSHIENGSASRDALVGAGCLRIKIVATGGTTPVEVTELGVQLLKVLEWYPGPQTSEPFEQAAPEGTTAESTRFKHGDLVFVARAREPPLPGVFLGELTAKACRLCVSCGPVPTRMDALLSIVAPDRTGRPHPCVHPLVCSTHDIFSEGAGR
jgi:hypothetical protein